MNIKSLFEPKVTNLPMYSALGVMAGLTASIIKNIPTMNYLKEHIKGGNTDTKAFIAEHAPEVTPITNEKDYEKHKDKFNIIERLMLDGYFKDPNNAYFKPGDNMIIAPKKTNPYVLAHELGHHKYFKNHKYHPALEITGFDIPLGIRLKEEQAAWDQSPIKIEGQGIELKDKALQTYRDVQNFYRGGAVAGLGAGLAAILIKNMRK